MNLLTAKLQTFAYHNACKISVIGFGILAMVVATGMDDERMAHTVLFNRLLEETGILDKAKKGEL